MLYTAHDMQAFYATRAGRLVARLLAAHVSRFWPDTEGRAVAGFGYAAPLMKPAAAGLARSFLLMPRPVGVHRWPEAGQGRCALVEEAEWPLETESVDRILIVHALEHADNAEAVMHEAWRVLKSNGRLLLIVPHRMGFWARAEWTPFGHGTPFTAGQIRALLQGSLFIRERSERALFMPPFRSFLALRSAYMFEALGRSLFPGLAGALIVEASKQVYAPVRKAADEKARAVAGRRYGEVSAGA